MKIMKITPSHGAYWLSKHAPAFMNARPVSIHALIPSGDPPAMGAAVRQAHNTLNICSMTRRREGTVVRILQQMADDPGCNVNPARRSGYCRKWLKKINNAKIRHP